MNILEGTARDFSDMLKQYLEFSTSIGVDEEEIRRNLSDEEYAYLKSK